MSCCRACRMQGQLPRTKYDHCQFESPVLAVRLCFFAAILNRLPCAAQSAATTPQITMALVLDNLAVLDDALDLRDQQGADTHWKQSESHCSTLITSNGGSLTLFANKRVVSVVRVVSIASRSAAAIAEGAKVKFCSFNQSGFFFTEKKNRHDAFLPRNSCPNRPE